jgi:hypothetical protein
MAVPLRGEDVMGFFEGGRDVAWYGKFAGTKNVVPFYGDTTVELGFSVNRNAFIGLAEGVD